MASADKNGRYLSKLFSGSALKQLADGCVTASFTETLKLSGLEKALDGTLGDMFDFIFDYMCRSYRSEYIYKNAIATKILEGRHSLRTATFLGEFRVNQSKADTVILNGTSSVYEIKTELDDLARLPSQLADYGKIFDRICVVTYAGGVDLLKKILPPHVGIITLTTEYTLRTHREPLSNKPLVDPETIFSSLRQKEYLSILVELQGFVPNVPDALVYQSCLEQFRRISPEQAHDAMVRVLRLRSFEREFIDFISALPRSLKSAGLASSLSKKQRLSLLSKLKLPSSVLL